MNFINYELSVFECDYYSKETHQKYTLFGVCLLENKFFSIDLLKQEIETDTLKNIFANILDFYNDNKIKKSDILLFGCLGITRYDFLKIVENDSLAELVTYLTEQTHEYKSERHKRAHIQKMKKLANNYLKELQK